MQLFRFMMIFSLIISLACLAGTSTAPRLSVLNLVHANPPPPANQYWYPAGPEMDTLFESVFTDESAEFNNLQGPSPSIDFTDAPLFASLHSTFYASPNFLLTRPELAGFNEIEFNLASNFWGCFANYGSQVLPPCDTYFRQGIAHLVDKSLFALDEPDIAGQAAAIDNPLSAGGSLPTPNSCSWDSHFPETGPSCIVGGTNPGGIHYTGGTAYRLAPASGVCVSNGVTCSNVPWLQKNPSPDFCAAAQDIADGFNLYVPSPPVTLMNPPMGFPNGSPSSWGFSSSTNCQLNIPHTPPVDDTQVINQHPITFYVRSDNPALKILGTSYAYEICAIFTGGFTDGCDSLNGDPGGLNVLHVIQWQGSYFPGYSTSPPNTGWGMFVAGAGSFIPPDDFMEAAHHLSEAIGSLDPFDTDLYYGFNSQFVSGTPAIQPPNGTCSSRALPSGTASNYMWLCNINYDTSTNQMENSSCIQPSTNSDVNTQVGSSSANLVNCSGATVLTCLATTGCPTTACTGCSALSAAFQAEDEFGKGAFTIPVYSTSVEYGYLNNGWTRVINSDGTFNYFNWLNAHNPSPTLPGTIRQGLSQLTHSLSPYIADTPQDYAILSGIYDSLYVNDPSNPDQFINWMTISTLGFSNSSLSYPAPAHTQTTYRFTLRSDLYFQDGRPVTAFDVAFSYLSLYSTGSMMGGTLSHMTGITILSSRQFDVGVDSLGQFALPAITAVPILPGRYWTSQQGLWDQQWSICLGNGSCYPEQYVVAGTTIQCSLNCTSFKCTDTCNMVVEPTKIVANFDPVAGTNLVGSGPWQCGTVTSTASGACTKTGNMQVSPGGSYTFQRFGSGISSCQVSTCYFRSSQNAALWIWSEQGGANSFLNFGALAQCYSQPVNLTGPCAHWQQGIGNPGSGSVVGLGQATIVVRFYALNWVAPFDWATNPPIGIAPFPPVLYEGTTTLSPASAVGCPTGYDC